MVKAKKVYIILSDVKKIEISKSDGKRGILRCVRAGMRRNHREARAFIRVEDELPPLLANFDNLVCCL